jgi:hypothetical protein
MEWQLEDLVKVLPSTAPLHWNVIADSVAQ